MDANLEGANLSQAQLESADLSGAKLVDADLSYARLDETFCVGANLDGANLDNAYLKGTVLEDADLTNASLKKARLIQTNLTSAKFYGADLSNSIIIAPKYKLLKLDEFSKFGGAIIDDVGFIDYISQFTKNVPKKFSDRKELKGALEKIGFSDSFVSILMNISVMS